MWLARPKMCKKNNKDWLKNLTTFQQLPAHLSTHNTDFHTWRFNNRLGTNAASFSFSVDQLQRIYKQLNAGSNFFCSLFYLLKALTVCIHMTETHWFSKQNQYTRPRFEWISSRTMRLSTGKTSIRMKHINVCDIRWTVTTIPIIFKWANDNISSLSIVTGSYRHLNDVFWMRSSHVDPLVRQNYDWSISSRLSCK